MAEDWIYRQGEAGRELYIIIEGSVALRGPRGPPRLMQRGYVDKQRSSLCRFVGLADICELYRLASYKE